MTSRSNRDYLKVQLLQAQRMLALLDNDPIMSPSLIQKEQALREALEKIPVDQKDSRVILLFNGNPVIGSMGIDAAFTGKVVVPFQNMVSAEFAHRLHGKVGRRGQMNSRNESRLFLTALPRGSFGIELSKLESNELFEEEQMADSLAHITELVESSSKSDEDFAAHLEGVTPRTIQSLKDFLKVISDEKAGFSIESGGIRCELNPVEVQSAHERVAGTITSEDEPKIHGTLKGILLESWRFDFIRDDGTTITGRIDENLTEEQATGYNAQYFNKPCTASFKEGKVLFMNGREKVTYTLTAIQAANP